jgi:DNA repair exonuclease SbcCD ATPase subunit
MATESLIVELDARTAKLDAKLNSTNDKLDKLTEKSEKSDSGLRKFGGGAKIAATLILQTAAAAAALAGAISAIVVSSANGRRELEVLASQAKTTTADFQALAFATSRYGIDAGKIADISKDVSDRVGEFATAGTGVFQDYADVMKLTKDEARAVAQEFIGMSSQEVLGKMTQEMEGANVSADQMLTLFEALSSDSSKIIPLFANNSKELIELKKRFDDVNSSLQITGTQAEALRDVSDTFTLMTSSIGNATTAISATLAPVLDGFFNDIIDIVPDATQTIIDFINSFLDAENISSVAAAQKRIEDSSEKIAHFTAQLNDQRQRAKPLISANLRAERETLAELEAQLIVLQEKEKKLQDVNRLSGGLIGGKAVTPVIPVTTFGLGTGDEIQAIAERFKQEETLLAEKLVRELQLIGDNNELKINLEKEFAENINNVREELREKQESIDKDAADKKATLDQRSAQARIAIETTVANNAVGLINMIGGENKAAAIAALVIQKSTALSANAVATFAGSQLAYASQLIPGDPTSVIRAGAAAAYVGKLGSLNAGLIIATGLGQAAGIANGGGAGGGGGTGGGGTQQQQPTQQNFEAETTSLQLSNATEGGGTNNTINFATDSGDELIDTISKLLNKGQKEGRF